MDDPEVLPSGKRGQGVRPGRALATITGVEPPPLPPAKRPLPAKVKTPFLPRDSTAEDAFHLTLVQCKRHIAANVPAVVDRRDIEGMHQLRVGFRRLRVALSSFGREFRTPSTETLRAHAKAISSRLAPARDLDVFFFELLEPAATANGAADAFAVLRSRAQAIRRQAWDDAVSFVASPAFDNFMFGLEDALDKRVWRGRGKKTSVFDVPATSLAERVLDHRLSQAEKRARHLDRLSDSERHRLRIALKKLRYTAEFFSPLYEREAVARFAKRLSGMQDVLGVLQDVAMARTTLKRLVDIDDGRSHVSRDRLSFAAGMVYGWHLECAARTWKKAVKRWKKFVKTEPFWNVPSFD